MRLRAILPALLSIGLAGCGFSPMYAANAPAATNGGYIGPVAIDEIPGKGGHVLKAELEKLLQIESGSGAQRRLVITTSEYVGGLGFRVDESASRSDLTMYANYVLRDPDGKGLATGSVSSTASYDVPSSAYGEIAAQEDARERAAENVAVLVHSQLSMKMAARKLAPPKPPTPPAP